MEPLDKERFGAFLCALRKEQGMTQKELAQRLFVSDKAVSKWERGQSVPDVALLTPLAQILGVTVTELLQGERTRGPLEPERVEELVSGALRLSEEEQARRARKGRFWRRAWVACAGIAALEVGALIALGRLTALELWDYLMLVEGLSLGFGLYFCWFAKEALPAFYDENRLNFYSDGPFRMSIPGIRFNNSNWPHILAAARGWLLGVAVVYPFLFAVGRRLLPPEGMLILTLASALSFFLPVYWAGRKYQ